MKTRRKRNYNENDYNLAFIDKLFGDLAIFVVLFIVVAAAMAVKPVVDANVKTDAQVIIELKWDDEVDCDVDLWVRDPSGAIAFYSEKDVGAGHLERDDMGIRTDTYTVDGKSVVSGGNHEEWLMRGIIPGTYATNVHLYRCQVPYTSASGEKSTRVLEHGDEMDLPVSLAVIKINPTYTVVAKKTVRFRRVWDEEFGFKFDIDGTGVIFNVKTNDSLWIDQVLEVVKKNNAAMGSSIPGVPSPRSP